MNDIYLIIFLIEYLGEEFLESRLELWHCCLIKQSDLKQMKIDWHSFTLLKALDQGFT